VFNAQLLAQLLKELKDSSWKSRGKTKARDMITARGPSNEDRGPRAQDQGPWTGNGRELP